MTWLRSAYLSHIRITMDAENHPRWGEPTLRALLGFVHADEARRLSDKVDHWNVLRTTATPVNGVIPFSDLTSGSGDTIKRTIRVRAVGQNGRPFPEHTTRQSPLLTPTSALTGGTRWFVENDGITLLGAASGPLDVVTRTIPVPADQLAGDDSTVDWPETHEMLLVYRVAAIALAQGGTETDAGRDLNQIVEGMLRPALYREYARLTERPPTIELVDDAAGWGGI